MNEYRKPGYYITFSEDESTTNLDEYLEEWRSMIRPVADKLGLICYAFDPDFALKTLDSKRTIALPVWFVSRLVRVLEGLSPVKELERLKPKRTDLEFENLIAWLEEQGIKSWP